MRLIVVDDDRLVVDSLKIILGAQPQIEVVGTGANGNDAVSLYAEHAPDIALLDIQMPGRDGLSAAREILERDPAARVVFLTTFSDDEYIVSALAGRPRLPDQNRCRRYSTGVGAGHGRQTRARGQGDRGHRF